MMHLEWISPAIDVGLFVSLLFFGLRMVRSSGPRVNLGRMAELEASLRGLLKEAETAGRQLNDQLLKRQRDIERALVESGSAESRLNRAITMADEHKGMLEVISGRAEAILKSANTRAAETRGQIAQRPTRNEVPAEMLSEERADFETVEAPSSRSRSQRMPQVSTETVEPPSFEVVMESRETPPPTRRRRLAEQVEREVSAPAPKAAARPSADRPVVDSEVLKQDGRAQNDARERARELQKNLLLNRESPAEEPARSSVLSAEEAATATRQDPRLGALGRETMIRRQVQTL